MKKARKALFLTILVVIPLFTSCFLFDFLSPQTTSSRSKMVMTVTPQSPTYVGENMVVRISTSPSRRQEFIRLTITNLITGTSQVLEENEVSSAEFTFAAPASNFTVMAEIPGYEKRLGKEKDKSWSGLQDFTPPNVTLSVQREDPTKSIFLVEVSVDEPHSTITSVGYSLDGQTRSLDLSRVGARGVASAQVPMEIGQHVFQGFATNQSQKKGYSQNTYLEVAPPFSTNPPQIQLLSPSESEPFIDCFQDEMVTISANISDGTSYLEEVRVFSDAGIRRIFEFDPLQKEYFLNYRFRVSESQTVQIIAINGNGIEEDETVWVDMINHRAPQITLSGPEGETPAGTPLTYNFTVTAQDGVNLSEVYFLADNSTVRSFQSIGEPSFSGSVRYTVPKKDHFLKVVAIDEMGARGESDEIQITGIVEDNDPPEIQLFFPSVAYQGFDTDLGFTCRDTGSGLDGNPSIVIGKTGETGNTIIPMTFDNQFFYTNWTPGSTGTYSCKVSAVDKAGNQAVRESIIEVKDPTGVLLPTVLNLGAFPDPVMIGNNVQINITIVPPAQGGGVTPIVQFEVTSPASANYSISPITQTGNVHSAIFTPFDEGLHSVFAHVQWGETSFTKNCTFRVLSPEPASDFTVYPTETYLGNMVTLSLNPYSSNPNANITVQSMTFAGRPLSWSIQSNPTTGLQMYVATTTTENNATGTNLARVQYTDNFGNVKNEEAPVLLKTPVVSITGFNITPRIGSQPQAYTPIYFEVTLDKNTIPSGIVPSGEITISELGDTPRAQVTVPLVQDASETNVLRSQRDWLPPKEGTYSLVANTSLQVGAFTFSDREEEIVEVFPAAIDITLDSEPVSLERITVGREIELEFSVFGVPSSDSIHSFQYAIFKGENIFAEAKTLKESPDASGVYRDTLDPFLEAGPYKLVATVTTIAPAVKAKSWNFSVLPSEIRQVSLTLDSNPNELFFGKEMFFTLQLENPSDRELGVRLFLVDKNRNRLMNIDPVIGAGEPTGTVFRNATPILLYDSCTFTAAASVSIIGVVPQIDLPTMYGETDYFMPPSTAKILVDDTKKFLVGFPGALDITIVLPAGMEIQDPEISVEPASWGAVDPNPESSTKTTTASYYRYKFTPARVGTPTIQISVYETTDLSKLDPLIEREISFETVLFRPFVKITGISDGETTLVQVKDPQIRMEISQLPEFFSDSLEFQPTLFVGSNSYSLNRFISTTSEATASFKSFQLSNRLGIGAASVTATVRPLSSKTFEATGSQVFDVVSPTVFNLEFDSSAFEPYITFQEAPILAQFANMDKATQWLESKLFMSDGRVYSAIPNLSSLSEEASIVFEDVFFGNEGTYTGYFELYSKNGVLVNLGTSETVTFTVTPNLGSEVEITYPLQDIFLLQPIQPTLRLVREKDVNQVKIAIIDPHGELVAEEFATEYSPNNWILGEETKVRKLGEYTVVATAVSTVLGIQTGQRSFNVIDGSIRVENPVLNISRPNSIYYPNDNLQFVTTSIMENPFTVPIQNAYLSPSGGGEGVLLEAISQSSSTVAGETKHELTWKVAEGTEKIAGDSWIFSFLAENSEDTDSSSLTFEVLPIVEPPLFTSNATEGSTVAPETTVWIQVSFSLPSDYADRIVNEISEINGDITPRTSNSLSYETGYITNTGTATYTKQYFAKYSAQIEDSAQTSGSAQIFSTLYGVPYNKTISFRISE